MKELVLKIAKENSEFRAQMKFWSRKMGRNNGFIERKRSKMRVLKLARRDSGFRRELIYKLATPDYKDYVKEKKRKGEKPLDKKRWEAKVLGKGKGKENRKTKSISDFQKEWLSGKVRKDERLLSNVSTGPRLDKKNTSSKEVKEIGKSLANLGNFVEDLYQKMRRSSGEDQKTAKHLYEQSNGTLHLMLEEIKSNSDKEVYAKIEKIFHENWRG